MKMGKINGPVLDAEGNHIYREDGSVVAEFDQWETIKYNWIGYTSSAIGFGLIAPGIGGWLRDGLRPKYETETGLEEG